MNSLITALENLSEQIEENDINHGLETLPLNQKSSVPKNKSALIPGREGSVWQKKDFGNLHKLRSI